MYKHHGKAEYQKYLNVPADYSVDGLIVVGTHPKNKEYPGLYKALERLGLHYSEEQLEQRFFQDIKSLSIEGKRIWFDVVYGAAYLSEVAHLANTLGSQRNVLIGSCGALREDLSSGDTVLPSASYGNESATRMYERESTSYLFDSDPTLRAKIKEHIAHRAVVDEGKLMTVQAMLAETKEDVGDWAREGYSGIDMESATLFAVSRHFNVPAAALLLVADNLVRNELVDDAGYKAAHALRTATHEENYEIALRVLLH